MCRCLNNRKYKKIEFITYADVCVCGNKSFLYGYCAYCNIKMELITTDIRKFNKVNLRKGHVSL